jgi:peptide/nickel transport system permease protein
LRRYPLGVIGAAIIGLFVFAAIFAPCVTVHDPFSPTAKLYLAPSASHWLGTDHLGRDVYSRIVCGAQISLLVGCAATFIGCGIGVAAGLVSGYLGGWVDLVVQRVVDMLQALPLFVIALVMAAALGPSLRNTIVAISVALIPAPARVIRANTLSLREQPFVEAARGAGMGELRVALRHVLPNTLAPLIVIATAQVGVVILIEAALSFLGLGPPEPHPSWGRMLSDEAAYVHEAPWLVIFPGLAISLVVFGINLLGDAVRDLLDPRQAAEVAPFVTIGRTAAPLSAPAAAGDGVAAALEVDGLRTYLFSRAGVVKAVDGVSLTLRRGETLAVVGESGCGKSMTALSIMRLVPSPPAKIVAGTVRLAGRDLLPLGDAEMRGVRGKEISMIFQEPMTSLNPVMTIGSQVAEALRLHQDLSRRAAGDMAVEMLQRVRIPEPARRAREYPHQQSGGMRQRAIIAMALACNPRVLIADEPTTALDVMIQAQILDLLLEQQHQLGTAILLITHNLGIVAETAQRVFVMYAGRKVEEAEVGALFARPLHPYTHGLLASVPHLSTLRGDATTERLQGIPGTVPPLNNLPPGCAFAPRCAFADVRCHAKFPPYEELRPRHWVACWQAERLYG